MKNAKKKTTLALGLLGGAILLSSCTASFCSPQDKAEILYPYEQGVTIYCSREDLPVGYPEEKAIPGNDNVYKYVPVEWDETNTIPTFKAKKSSFLPTSLSSLNTLFVSATWLFKRTISSSTQILSANIVISVARIL